MPNLSSKIIVTVALLTSLLLAIDLKCQGIGVEAGYVLAPSKEAFAGRIYFVGGSRYDWSNSFRIGFGYEKGKFNSEPTGRVLPYFSVKTGMDYSIPLLESVIAVYIGGDFEYLQTTRIVDESRISIFPKSGLRFFNILFFEFSADNLKEPGNEPRIFNMNINSYRATLGFCYRIGG